MRFSRSITKRENSLGLFLLLTLSSVLSIIIIGVPSIPPVHALPVSQSNSCHTVGTAPSLSCAFGSNVVAGDGLILFFGTGVAESGLVVSDTLGNSWVHASGTLPYGHVSGYFDSYYVKASASSGADTVTFDPDGVTSANLAMTIFEITGPVLPNPATPVAVAFSGGGGSSTASVTSFTPGNNDLLFMALSLGSAVTCTTPTGFTRVVNNYFGTECNTGVMGDFYFGEATAWAGGATTVSSTLGASSTWDNVVVDYEQVVTDTVTLNPAPGSTAISAGNYFTISYNLGGSPQTVHATGTTTTFQADAATQVSISSTSSSSGANERWCILSSISASGSTCNTTTFYSGLGATGTSETYNYGDQVLQSSSYSVIGGGSPTAPTMNYMTGSPAPSSSIVGCWTLQEGTGSLANDCSSNNNVGTLTGSPTWQSAATCANAMNLGCLSFASASSQYIALGNVLDQTTGSFTIAGWVDPTTLAGCNNCAFVMKGVVSSEKGYGIRIEGGTGQLSCYAIGAAATVDVTSGGPKLLTGQMNFIACTFGVSSGTITLTTYVGCTLGNTASGTAGSLTNTHNLFIGDDDSNEYMNGAVTSVLFYSTALTATQECQLYQSYTPATNSLTLGGSASPVWVNKGSTYTTTSPTTGSSSTERWAANEGQTNGLVGYWPMMEGSGLFTADLTTNDDYGTLTSTSQWVGTPSNCEFPSAGTCLSFTRASSQDVMIPSSSSLNFASSTTPFTISSWFSVTSTSVTQNMILSKNGACIGCGDTGYGMRVEIGGQVSGYLLNTGSIECSSGSATASINTWYMSTFVNTGSGCIMYLDAVAQPMGANTAASISNNCPLLIGADAEVSGNVCTSTAGSAFLDGKEQDPRAYSFALSAGQVSELYAAGPNSPLTISGPLAPVYYHQFSGTLNYAISGGGSPTAPTLTSTKFGLTVSPTLTTTATAYWFDSRSLCSTTNPLTGSSGTERWQTATTCNSGNTITGSFTQTFTYYNQYLLTYSYIITYGGSPDAPTLTCDQFGQTFQVTLTGTATGYFCDNGQTWTVGPNPLASSTNNERWEVNTASQAVTGTVSGTLTTIFNFYHQLGKNFAFSTSDTGYSNAPDLYYYQFASRQTTLLTTSYVLFWIDAGTSWQAQSPWISSPDLMSWNAAPLGGTMVNTGSTNPLTISYSAGTSCTGFNPLTNLENGCLALAFVQTYSTTVTMQVAVGIMISGVAIALWIKTQNGWIPIMVWISAAGSLGYLLPAQMIYLSLFFIVIAITGTVVKLFSPRGSP